MLTLGVAGVSGAGKSSTLNAIFGTRLPVAHTTAGGRELARLHLGRLTVIEAPGLGEDARRDPTREYAEQLADCDVLLWVLAARSRGLALDQSYLDRLAVPRDRLVFGVNQVDLIEPGDWSPWNVPSGTQEQRLLEIIEDRKARLATTLGRARPVVGYSATRAFRLQELFTELVAACPPGRAAVLRAAKNLRPGPPARAAAEHQRERAALRREGIHP
jgi:hypothetical protein